MAAVLRCSGAWNVDCVISFLIVAEGNLCDKIFTGINNTIKTRKYQIALHKSESIADIIELKQELHVDFIVFAFDGRIGHSVNQIEKDLSLLDEFFIISGRVCLVNCYGYPNSMGLTIHSANRLRDKYCIRLLSTNVYNSDDLNTLGEKILNLAEALMGIHTGIPDLNMLSTLR